jgi:hypothetical protein
MNSGWTPEQLEQIGAARELEIASRGPDGTLRQWLPIWVVCAGEQVYVRTWHRRATGWFGRVVDSRQARIRVRGLETDVSVQDIGGDDPDLRSAIDEAYRLKYGSRGGAVGQMITDSAAATTLRLARSD